MAAGVASDFKPWWNNTNSLCAVFLSVLMNKSLHVFSFFFEKHKEMKAASRLLHTIVLCQASIITQTNVFFSSSPHFHHYNPWQRCVLTYGRYNHIFGDLGLTRADCFPWCETHLFFLFRERRRSQVKLRNVTLHNEKAHRQHTSLTWFERGKKVLLFIKFDWLFSSLIKSEHFPADVFLGTNYHIGGDNILLHQNQCHWVVLMQKVIHRSITSRYILRMSFIVC